MILRRGRYFVHQTILAMARAPLVQVIAMATISVALFVVFAFATVMINLDHVADQWGREMGLVAFFENGFDPVMIEKTKNEVKEWPEVRSIIHRTRADALKELRDTLGSDADLLHGIGPEILPVTLELVLEPAHRDLKQREQISRRLASVDGLRDVARIDYGADLMARVTRVRNILSVSGFIVGAFVLLSVLFIISNTVRLTLFARRDEIEIMQLVGATNTFIRIPFYLEGFLQGCLGALLAASVTVFLGGVITGSAQQLVTVSFIDKIIFLSPMMVMAFILGSGTVGILASHLAVQRYLESGE